MKLPTPYKFYLLLISLFFYTSAFSQNIEYTFTTKTKLLEEMKQNSKAEYHLIYVYAPWCKPCKKHLPKLLTYLKNNSKVKLYLLDYDNSSSIYIPEHKFLQSIGYSGTIYQIDLSYYDKKPYTRHKDKRYNAFLDELIPWKTGRELSKYILFDKDLKLVYVSELEDKKLSTLNQFIFFSH